MSVNVASKERLGKLLACAIRGARDIAPGRTAPVEDRLLDVLMGVHEAQRKAFSATYRGEEYDRLSRAELRADALWRVPKLKSSDCKDASSEIGNLAYNMVSNGGTDFGTPELELGLKALAGGAQAAAIVMSKAELAASNAAALTHARANPAATMKLAPRPAGIKAYDPPPLVLRETSKYIGGQAVKVQEEHYDRRTASSRIKKALRARTGLPWQVRTSDTYLDGIDVTGTITLTKDSEITLRKEVPCPCQSLS